MSETNEEVQNEQTASQNTEATVTPEKPKKGCGSRLKKIGCVTLIIVLCVLGIVSYFWFYWAFAEGVKSGNLNYMTKKGYVFKTYEGRLIQDGFKSDSVGIQNNEFIFSVSDNKVAEQLENATGKNVQLHYTEYNHSLWWRGNSEFIVDSVISINNVGVNPYNQPLTSGVSSNYTGNNQQETIESLTKEVEQLKQELEATKQALQAAQQQQTGTVTKTNPSDRSQRVFKDPNQ